MTKDEALKLALDALEVCDQSNYGRNWVWPDTAHPTAMKNVREVITAIKEALAQPEPWEKFCDSNCVWTDHHPDCKLAEQEPVAWLKVGGMGAMPALEKEAWLSTGRKFDRQCVEDYTIPLYTTPPQRKPLTDAMREQMRFLGFDTLESRTPFVAGWLKAEAAHGIKGEA